MGAAASTQSRKCTFLALVSLSMARKSIQADRKKFSELIAVSDLILKFSKANICFLQRKYSSILHREK